MPGFLPSACSKYGSLPLNVKKLAAIKPKRNVTRAKRVRSTKLGSTSNDKSKSTNPALSLPFRGLQSIITG